MFPLWGTFFDTVHCWSYRSRCKLSCMVLREAEFQLWQWIGRWHYFTPFAFSFFSQYFLSYQTSLIRLLFYHLSGGKNCVLFSFHTIPGAIRSHVLSPRLRWGFYMANKHKQAAHSCLCTGKGRKGEWKQKHFLYYCTIQKLLIFGNEAIIDLCFPMTREFTATKRDNEKTFHWHILLIKCISCMSCISRFRLEGCYWEFFICFSPSFVVWPQLRSPATIQEEPSVILM